MADPEPTGPTDELERLLMELVDGEPTPAQRRSLAALLRDDPDSRRRYTRYLLLESFMAWELSHVGKEGGLPAEADAQAAAVATADMRQERGEAGPGPQPRRSRSRRLVALAAAAVLVVVLATFLADRVASRKPGGLPPEVAGPAALGGRREGAGIDAPRPGSKPLDPRAVAVLTRVVNAVWGPTELPTEQGSALPAGRLRLTSGLVQLEFYGGVIVVLEGPADFELIAADRAYCRRGRMRVRAPLKSSRFSVGTPKTDVVDLGTEFGVVVDAVGGSEVQVFEGSVELHDDPRSAARGRLLSMGEGLRIDAGGSSRQAEADPNAFVGPREMQQRASTEAGRRYRSWLEFSRKLQADPSLLTYYSFEGQQPWDRTLLDRSVRPGPRRNGGIVGCQWDEGRWPGKAALDFRRTSDRIRVDIPGEFDALTLMTWVRVDYFNNRLNALLLSDGWEHNEVHWELNGDGVLIFAVRDGVMSYSPVVLAEGQLGLWTHLAAVYDSRRRTLTTYVNGRAVHSDAVAADGRVVIGSANLGNYGDPAPDEASDRVIRNLNGRIDEFLIFDRALDAREIRAIYEMGKPTS